MASDNPTTESPFDLGKRAYNEGEPISVWPISVATRDEYEEWRRGWDAAWKEDQDD